VGSEESPFLHRWFCLCKLECGVAFGSKVMEGSVRVVKAPVFLESYPSYHAENRDPIFLHWNYNASECKWMKEGKNKIECCRSLDVVFYYFVLLQMSPRES